jgi:uncharacterized membrane protein
MPSHTASPLSQASAYGLAMLLGVAGVAHFIATPTYALIVPRVLPAPRVWVLVSGAAELGCAGLLLAPRTRRAGAWCTLALLLGVWPANMQMALNGGIAGHGRLLGDPLAAWVRVPLQIPLCYWAYRLTRSPVPATSTARVHDPD